MFNAMERHALPHLNSVGMLCGNVPILMDKAVIPKPKTTSATPNVNTTVKIYFINSIKRN